MSINNLSVILFAITMRNKLNVKVEANFRLLPSCKKFFFQNILEISNEILIYQALMKTFLDFDVKNGSSKFNFNLKKCYIDKCYYMFC